MKGSVLPNCPDCFTFPEECHGMRIDAALARCFPSVSRVLVRRSLDAGLISSGGLPLRARMPVVAGLRVNICWVQPRPISLKPKYLALSILHEDEELLAIDKPPNAVVHPTPLGEKSLVEAVLAHTDGQLSSCAGPNRPGVIHRLDRETTGILLFAKTNGAHRMLENQFASRKVTKTYEALAAGVPNILSGRVIAPIGRDPRHRTRMSIAPGGKSARTDWRIRPGGKGNFSHFFLHPHTGRTHQIRVHLASMGHPILGDELYGFDGKKYAHFQIPRILLHASTLKFMHPTTGKWLEISAPLPEDMARLSEEESE
ncbi:MAG: RluA family pseudouridine synthase [Puniceicoccales bacterium]|jgi:23S rRNA pseudouridine1911/1915/1917 synthase|nr:RluA family pseudouridine synthase [Puniceicoccales bacterium]